MNTYYFSVSISMCIINCLKFIFLGSITLVLIYVCRYLYYLIFIYVCTYAIHPFERDRCLVMQVNRSTLGDQINKFKARNQIFVKDKKDAVAISDLGRQIMLGDVLFFINVKTAPSRLIVNVPLTTSHHGFLMSSQFNQQMALL